MADVLALSLASILPFFLFEKYQSTPELSRALRICLSLIVHTARKTQTTHPRVLSGMWCICSLWAKGLEPHSQVRPPTHPKSLDVISFQWNMFWYTEKEFRERPPRKETEIGWGKVRGILNYSKTFLEKYHGEQRNVELSRQQPPKMPTHSELSPLKAVGKDFISGGITKSYAEKAKSQSSIGCSER